MVCRMNHKSKTFISLILSLYTCLLLAFMECVLQSDWLKYSVTRPEILDVHYYDFLFRQYQRIPWGYFEGNRGVILITELLYWGLWPYILSIQYFMKSKDGWHLYPKPGYQPFHKPRNILSKLRNILSQWWSCDIFLTNQIAELTSSW